MELGVTIAICITVLIIVAYVGRLIFAYEAVKSVSAAIAAATVTPMARQGGALPKTATMA